MIPPTPAAGQESLNSLVRATMSRLVLALGMGVCFWSPAWAALALGTNHTFPARLYVLMVVMGDQVGFLLASWSVLASLLRQAPNLRPVLAGVLVMVLSLFLGLTYDQVLRWGF